MIYCVTDAVITYHHGIHSRVVLHAYQEIFVFRVGSIHVIGVEIQKYRISLYAITVSLLLTNFNLIICPCMTNYIYTGINSISLSYVYEMGQAVGKVPTKHVTAGYERTYICLYNWSI